jgi:hypothetical protein
MSYADMLEGAEPILCRVIVARLNQGATDCEYRAEDC